MNIPFKKIIDKKILLLARLYDVPLLSLNIENIIIFESKDTPLTRQSLVFFSSKFDEPVSSELFTHISELSCIAVFQETDSNYKAAEEFAEKYPLIIAKMPFNSTISDCIKYCYEIALTEASELSSFSFDSMQAFFDCIMRNKKEDGYIMDLAMGLLDCPVAFATSDFSIQHFPSIPQEFIIQAPFYANNDDFDWFQAMASFRLNSAKLYQKLATGINGQIISGYKHQNSYLKRQKRHALIFPIVEMSVCYGYILIAPDDQVTDLSPKQSIIIQQLQVILKLEISKSDEIAQTINRYYDFILDELLKSDDTNFEKLIQKYGLVKKTIYDDYYVLVCGRTPYRSDTGYVFYEFLTSQRFNNIYAQLCVSFNTLQLFMFEKKDSIILLIPGSIIKERHDLEEGSSPLRTFFKEQFQGIGISQRVSKDSIRDGYFQAMKCLSLSIHSPNKETFFYEDLGILKFFFDNSNNLDAEPLLQTYKEYILPVYEYDMEHGTDLLPTLSEYIACCSSTSLICEKLHIHKNTLYSRLNKISSLIHCDFSNSDVLFNVNLGLKVHTLINTGMLNISAEKK